MKMINFLGFLNHLSFVYINKHYLSQDPASPSIQSLIKLFTDFAETLDHLETVVEFRMEINKYAVDKCFII